MIDNYDSFTYNVVQYLGELGADVKVVRNDEISCAEIADLKPTKIVISPGPVSYTHLRAHETVLDLVCRLLLEKKN